MRRSASTAVRSALLAFAVVLGATPLAAWTPETQLLIGETAASIAPPDLARQFDRHRKAFRRGVLEPFKSARGSAHEQNAPGAGGLEAALLRAVEHSVASIRGHRSFEEIVFRFGIVAHLVADAGNPLASSDADPREADYFVDYLRYVESVSPRFPLVFYAEGRDLESASDLELLVGNSLRRGRHLYPMIGREYERVGSIDGVALFDDRSTAFGVGSVAVSHAVSDVAAVMRYVWIEAGGGDARSLGLTPPHPPDIANDQPR